MYAPRASDPGLLSVGEALVSQVRSARLQVACPFLTQVLGFTATVILVSASLVSHYTYHVESLGSQYPF